MKRGSRRAGPKLRRAARLLVLAVFLVLVGEMPGLTAQRDCEASQTDMNLCAIEKSKATETSMNRLYQKLMKKVDEEKNKMRLRAAQEAWLQYRKKQCEFDTSGSEGGSVMPMLIADCYRGITLLRIKEIKDLLHCEEGVLGCPVW